MDIKRAPRIDKAAAPKIYKRIIVEKVALERSKK